MTLSTQSVVKCKKCGHHNVLMAALCWYCRAPLTTK